LKIECLAPEQEARLPEFVAKWRAIGLATEPADRPRAERAIRLAYEAGGLKPPGRILWTPSPLAAGLAQIALTGPRFAASVGGVLGSPLKQALRYLDWDAAIDGILDKNTLEAVAFVASTTAADDVVAVMVAALVAPIIGTSVKDTLISAINSEVTERIVNTAGHPLLNTVRRKMEAGFSVAFRAEMLSAIEAQFVHALKDTDNKTDGAPASVPTFHNRDSQIISDPSVSGSTAVFRNWMASASSIASQPIFSGSAMSMHIDTPEEAAARRLAGQFGYGQHDASQLALFDFLQQVCDIPMGNVSCLLELAQSAGWWLPYKHICWVSERPQSLHVDTRGRLHNEDGPALAYPDGFSIYAAHGVRLPEYVIERPQEITPEKIKHENNAEIRRMMLAKYGESRYLEAIGAQAIHQDGYGQLFRVEFWGDEPLAMVRYIDPSTGRIYFHRVDPDAYGGRAGREARAAIASTWRYADGTMVFARPEDYVLTVES